MKFKNVHHNPPHIHEVISKWFGLKRSIYGRCILGWRNFIKSKIFVDLSSWTHKCCYNPYESIKEVLFLENLPFHFPSIASIKICKLRPISHLERRVTYSFHAHLLGRNLMHVKCLHGMTLVLVLQITLDSLRIQKFTKI